MLYAQAVDGVQPLYFTSQITVDGGLPATLSRGGLGPKNVPGNMSNGALLPSQTVCILSASVARYH